MAQSNFVGKFRFYRFMNKILLFILGIIVVVVCVLILVEILQALFTFVIFVSVLIIVVGGAFLILRQSLRNREHKLCGVQTTTYF